MYVSALHTCDVFPSALDRAWLGSQAFGSASAFNANIGAWNTARVTDLTTV
jgi:surface protein